MTHRQNSNGRNIVGIILIALGGLLFLRNMNFFVWNFNIFTWPVILLVIGIIILAKNKHSAGGLILVVIGTIGIISRYTIFSFRYLISEYWPFIIIAFGVYLILKRSSGSTLNEKELIDKDEYYLDAFSLLQGKVIKIRTKNFLGGKITSLLSGYKIDLTEAELIDNKTLDIVTIFGGTEIFVPQGTRIIFNATTVFGGFEDNRFKHSFPESESENILIIKGLILFGGVEIKR